MGRSNGEFFTDFVRLGAEVLAHQEHLPGARRQRGEALLQRLEERLLLERLLGPGLRRLAPVAGAIEELVQVIRRQLGLGRPLAAGAAQRVDDLVLEDPGEPGAQVRAPGEALFRGERREERFLYCVFGGLAVAELQRGEAEKVGPERFDFRAKPVGMRGAQALGPSYMALLPV